MDLLRSISEQRDKQILGRARPFLEDDEQVEHWVRVRPDHGRREGFAYVTHKRCVVVWPGADDGHADVAWDKISAWGINPRIAGPVVCIEAEGESRLFQILVRTNGMAERARLFLEYLSERAPKTQRSGSAEREFRDDVPSDLRPAPLSWTQQTRRVVTTVIGGLLVVGGIVLLILPGPGILVTFLGLAVLASEYDWAKDLQHWAKDRYKQTAERIKQR